MQIEFFEPVIGSGWTVFERIVTLVGVLATAIFTGLMALIAWAQFRGRIVLESSWALAPTGGKQQQIEIEIALRNYTKRAVQAWQVSIPKFPIRSLMTNIHKTTGSVWPANTEPISLRVEPDKAGKAMIKVFPQWRELCEARPSIWARLLSRGRGTRLRVCIKVQRHPQSRFPRIIKHTIWIPRDIVEKNAAA